MDEHTITEGHTRENGTPAGGGSEAEAQFGTFARYFTSTEARHVASRICNRDRAAWVDPDELVSEGFIRVTRALENRKASGRGPIVNEAGTWDDTLVAAYAKRAMHGAFYDLMGSNRKLSRTSGVSFDDGAEDEGADGKAGSGVVSHALYQMWERGDRSDASSTAFLATAGAQLARMQGDGTLDRLYGKHGALVGCMAEKILGIIRGDPEASDGPHDAEHQSGETRGGTAWFDRIVYEALGFCDARYLRPDGGHNDAARQMKHVLSPKVTELLRRLISDRGS